MKNFRTVPDLLNIKDYFKFKICKTIEFLGEFKDT